MSARGFSLGAGRARLFGRRAGAGALAAVVLVLAVIAVAPKAHLPGLLGIAAASGALVMAAAVLFGQGKWAYALDTAGVALMLLGIAAGALLPNGLDAASILPLAGAVLTVPEKRGRPLAALFALALAASVAGQTAAYTYGGMANLVGSANVPRALVESCLMTAFIYGLVCWVADRWWAATTRAQHALVSQRRLLEVNERLLSTLDPEGVLSLIANSLKPLLAYDNLTIYQVDREAGVVKPVVARDRFARLIMGTTFPLDTGVTGWVVEHGEAQCVNDIHLDRRAATIPGTPDEPESLMVVPLLVRGQVAGTLNVGRMGKSEAHFSPGEFELARLFAGQASIALQNAEIHREMSNRAQTDALTGLRNRGAFDERLRAFIENPSAHPCALIMLDLDGFKNYNDRYGHPAGDTVLQAVGRAIDSAVRERDLTFRYGGDEFAILLPRTNIDPAAQVAKRVRRAIKEHPIVAGMLTASAGLACHPIHADGGAALVSAADAALYRAKALGGDRAAICGRGHTVRPELAQSERRRTESGPRAAIPSQRAG